MTLTSFTCKNAMFLGVLGPNEEEIQRENNAKYHDWFSNFMTYIFGHVLRIKISMTVFYTLKGRDK
jgi:hypothetical protein